MSLKVARANVDPVRQQTQFSCMATSMSMGLKALGIDADEAAVNKVMGASPLRGASWEDALGALQYFGCRATLICPATLKQLKAFTDKGLPVMVSWNPEGRPWSHASLIYQIDDDLRVHVADPNIPDPEETVRVVDKATFYGKWYEQWPNFLARRIALVMEREVDPQGRQVVASKRSIDESMERLTRLAETSSRMTDMERLKAASLALKAQRLQGKRAGVYLRPRDRVVIDKAPAPWMRGVWIVVSVDRDGSAWIRGPKDIGMELHPPGVMDDHNWFAVGPEYDAGAGDGRDQGPVQVQVQSARDQAAGRQAAALGQGRNGYIAYFHGKQVEVMADTALQARDLAVGYFKARRPQDVNVVLAEKGGQQVTHNPVFANAAPVVSRYEEGVPADPTENMSPEDVKEWWRQNAEHRDNFKGAGRRARQPREAASGLYGSTKQVQAECQRAIGRLSKRAGQLARDLWTRDEKTAQFLSTHHDRTGSVSARILREAMSEMMPHVASRRTQAAHDVEAKRYGLYGYNARTAKSSLKACEEFRIEASEIANGLHQKRAEKHAQVTHFLTSHSKEGSCRYSSCILRAYPDATVRMASVQPPSSVEGWLTWED